LARFSRQKGYETVYSCGTDDHGTPIQISAEAEGKNPKEYVDYWRKRWVEDLKGLGISFDVFTGTDTKENTELATEFFVRLREKGFIYEQNVIQYYCEKDNRSLPDRYVKGTCPHCGAQEQYADVCESCGRFLKPGDLKEARCSVCGTQAVLKPSHHYVFALSKLGKSLKEWLEGNQRLQSDVKNYVFDWLKEGLQDWDITRDISWGIQIPGTGGAQTLYGWFENHLGYISITSSYLRTKGISNPLDYWNQSEIIHFIGKDIVYHHYLFLPAERIADGRYKLPDQIPTRGHLLLQAKKFSKSRGWYISLRAFLAAFPADYLRFYLSSITSYNQSDINFDWNQFADRINNELIASAGNLFFRVTKFIEDNYSSQVPEAKGWGAPEDALVTKIGKAVDNYEQLIEKGEYSEALKGIVNVAHTLNQYFQSNEPWKNKEAASKVVYAEVNALRTLLILLYPFTPFSSKRLWGVLNLDEDLESGSFESAKDFVIKPGHRIDKTVLPFEKIEKGKIEEQLNRLAAANT